MWGVELYPACRSSGGWMLPVSNRACAGLGSNDRLTRLVARGSMTARVVTTRCSEPCLRS